MMDNEYVKRISSVLATYSVPHAATLNYVWVPRDPLVADANVSVRTKLTLVKPKARVVSHFFSTTARNV